MSGIEGKGLGLQDYLLRARESGKGDVRFSTGGELINKGQLGHKVATWLKMGDVESRGDRTTEAMKGFREALTRDYGKDYANDALLKAGIIDSRGDFTDKFTGGQILKSVELIKDRIEIDFKESLKNESDKHGLEGKDRSIFERRFSEGLDLLTEGGAKPVSRDQVLKLGSHIAQQVKGAGENIGMTEVDRMRLDDSTKSLLHVDVFRDPGKMMGRLVELDQDLRILLNDEGDTDKDRGETKLSISLSKSIKARTEEDFDTMLELPGRSLGSNSSLRGIYCAAREIFQNPYEKDNDKKENAKRIMDHCESMVRGFARGSAPVTDSIERDLEILGNTRTLDPDTLRKSRDELGKQIGEW